jgi:hypothetical protein
MKRKKKTELALLKEELWELCKFLTRKVYGYTCYTCGTSVEYPHTGHFITDSTCSTELSYDLRNLRPQCYVCNIHKSGNWYEFERRLLKEHGHEYVQDLKERNEKTKGLQYDILWYRMKVEEYKNKKALLESL